MKEKLQNYLEFGKKNLTSLSLPELLFFKVSQVILSSLCVALLTAQLAT